MSEIERVFTLLYENVVYETQNIIGNCSVRVGIAGHQSNRKTHANMAAHSAPEIGKPLYKPTADGVPAVGVQQWSFLP